MDKEQLNNYFKLVANKRDWITFFQPRENANYTVVATISPDHNTSPSGQVTPKITKQKDK